MAKLSIQEAIRQSAKSGTNYEAARVAAHARHLLSEASHHQTLYWRSLSALETALGVEIDSRTDLQTQTIESLLCNECAKLEDDAT